MKFTIGLAGEAQLSRTLLRTSERASDARPAFEAIADRLAAENLQNFTTEGAYASGGWAPLSPRYRAWKERHYPGKPILELTGELKRQLTTRPFGLENITQTEMEVGTTLPYAAFHQFGTTNMPRRRPLELTAQARDEMAKLLQRYLMTGEV